MACVADPAVIDLCRRRGDTFADQFTLKDASRNPIDITGFTFLLTVDPSATPPDTANNLFQIAGTITDAVNGVVEFSLTALQADQIPSTYFYDIQQTDAGSAIRTIVVGEYVFAQDITK